MHYSMQSEILASLSVKALSMVIIELFSYGFLNPIGGYADYGFHFPICGMDDCRIGETYRIVFDDIGAINIHWEVYRSDERVFPGMKGINDCDIFG